MPLLSVRLFRHYHSIITHTLMIPSCSFLSSLIVLYWKHLSPTTCSQLTSIADWMSSNLLGPNSAKTKFLLFRQNKIHNPILNSHWCSRGSSYCLCS